MKSEEAIKRIKEGSYKSYDPDIVNTFVKIITDSLTPSHSPVTRVKVRNLKPGMYLIDEITLENGVLLVPKGVLINEGIINKIKTFESLLRMDREVEIKNAKVTAYKGETQLRIGRHSKMRVIGNNEEIYA